MPLERLVFRLPRGTPTFQAHDLEIYGTAADGKLKMLGFIKNR